MSIITLDYEKNIILNDSISSTTNFHAAHYLPVGLYSLATTVREKEINEGKKGHHTSLLSFSHETLFISCVFHWFGVSIVNYLRLIALVDFLYKNNAMVETMDNPTKKRLKIHCSNYVENIIPDIYKWRNKVGAHFALTDPYRDDNMGTLVDSVMMPVGYQNPYFHVGLIKYAKGGEDSELPSWALTKTYEELAPRFWPNSKLPILEK